MRATLPGIQPLAPGDWIWVDDAYGAQMALRDQLIAGRRGDVVALHRDGEDAAAELLQTLLTALREVDGYLISGDRVTRPDGVDVALDMNAPLVTAGRLVQEDLCLVQKIAGKHVMTGAVLCFPAGWTLGEKMMRSLAGIHSPVAEYDVEVDRRVNRLFDAIGPGRPLWRVNGFLYESPELFAPYREAQPRPRIVPDARYFRAERQCFLRLPASNAVVFSIHTFMVDRDNLSDEQARNIGRHLS